MKSLGMMALNWLDLCFIESFFSFLVSCDIPWGSIGPSSLAFPSWALKGPTHHPWVYPNRSSIGLLKVKSRERWKLIYRVRGLKIAKGDKRGSWNQCIRKVYSANTKKMRQAYKVKSKFGQAANGFRRPNFSTLLFIFCIYLIYVC